MVRGWGAVALGYTLAGLITTIFASNLHIMQESWLDRMVPFDATAIWIYLSFFLIIAFAYFAGPKDRIERLVRAMQICAGVACISNIAGISSDHGYRRLGWPVARAQMARRTQ
jgi:hypothetical protein